MSKHIHFIGICGVAMSALALAFKKKGWTVTGSDVGFYPPISTHLKDNGVEYYAGWHPERMGKPDLVVVGNVASSTNPEYLYVQEHKINFKSYPEVIKEYFVQPLSVVCAGTYGKTTSTALLTWILWETGLNLNYMFGGLMQSDFPSAALSSVQVSVLEGDEYKASRWDNGPKFAYYSPTHLLLTSVVWDHADVYPTEEKYINEFKKLVAGLPTNATLVISEQAKPIINPTLKNTFSYGPSPTSDYSYADITHNKDGISFTITDRITNNQYQITSRCFGEYMADNITGCFAMAVQLGIKPDDIIAGIKSFPGMKRRLEKRYASEVTVFDDIAHSPTKAKSTLATLRHVYGQKIIAIFEPNTGNRRPQARTWYDGAFKDANVVVLPKLTKVKTDDHEESPMEGDEIARVIGGTHPDVRYIAADDQLVADIAHMAEPGDVVVFLGSHGFRGMIESLITHLNKK